MSWLFSQALVAEYSDRISWDGEQCAQLNVKPTQHKFWRNDKMMEFSRLSQFGLTCSLLTEDHGEELLTLYLADFHARTLVQQEKAQVSTVLDQACGPKWLELLVKYDLDSCSWKTHQCLFPEDLPESSVTLPKWGMTRNGHVFQHPILERPINETDFGLLPTPTVRDSRSKTSPADFRRNSPGLEIRAQTWPTPCSQERGGSHKPGSHLTLSKAVNGWTKGKTGQDPRECRVWPTPKASDWNKRGNVSAHPRNGLTGAVMNFPTPTASDATKWSNQSLAERKAKGQQVRLNTAVSPRGGNGGRLNPDWVEWLMGWPIGWTDLKPLEMDKFQLWQSMHIKL